MLRLAESVHAGSPAKQVLSVTLRTAWLAKELATFLHTRWVVVEPAAVVQRVRSVNLQLRTHALGHLPVADQPLVVTSPTTGLEGTADRRWAAKDLEIGRPEPGVRNPFS